MGLATEAAAQTVTVPATQTVNEPATHSRVSMTFTGDPGGGSSNNDVGTPEIVSGGTASGRESFSSISCAAGDDFVVQKTVDNGVFIVAGQSTHTSSTFTVCADTLDEPTETFTIKWSSSAAHDHFDGSASHCHSSGAWCDTTFTLIDDDPTVVSLARVGSGAVTEGGKVEFTVSLGRALVAGETIDVPLSIGGTNVTTGDWSLAEKSGATNTGASLIDPGTSTPKVRFSGANAEVATLELTATADGTAESSGSETFTIALGANSDFDDTALGTDVGGGADPHATASMNSFDLTVNDPTTYPSTENATQTLHVLAPGQRVEGGPIDYAARNLFGPSYPIREFMVTLGAVAHTTIEYKMCFTGTATLGTDYVVRKGNSAAALNGNCVEGLQIIGSCLTWRDNTCTVSRRERNQPDNGDKISIRVLMDEFKEGNESVIATLTITDYPDFPDNNGSYARGSSATYTIVDDDPNGDPEPETSASPSASPDSVVEVQPDNQERAAASDDTAPPKDYSAVIADVRGYATETQNGQPHVDRWMRVLAAFGDDNGYTAMTAEEAREMSKRFSSSRWNPVAEALTELEAEQAAEPESEPEPEPEPDPVPVACVSPELQSDVEGYSKENHNGPAHVDRWLKVLRTFANPGDTSTIMTPEEAKVMMETFSRNRWEPVYEAIKCLEEQALQDAL